MLLIAFEQNGSLWAANFSEVLAYIYLICLLSICINVLLSLKHGFIVKGTQLLTVI